MSLFRKRSPDTTPFTPVDSEATDRVLETLENSDLDPKATLLVGSAALALHGAVLHTTSGETRPGDVDLLTTTGLAQDVFAKGSFNGEPVTIKDNWNHKVMTVLRLDTAPLPIDLITAPLHTMDPAAYDARLRKRIAAARPIIGMNGYRIISLDDIIRAQKNNMDEKSRYDLASAYELRARQQRGRHL